MKTKKKKIKMNFNTKWQKPSTFIKSTLTFLFMGEMKKKKKMKHNQKSKNKKTKKLNCSEGT